MLSVRDAIGTEITDLSHIAHINPLRYRGYYYDSEIGLYYLNARYYDPEVGRFINPDNNLAGGLNLFAYCYNNPVMFFDPSGEVAIVDDVVVVTLVGGTVLTMATANYYTWLASPEGQKAINEGAKAIDSAGKAITNAARWVGDKTQETWNWLANSTKSVLDNFQFASEHTKGARPSTKNKHQKGNARKQREQKRSNNPNKRRR